MEINLNESASLYPLVGVELDTLDDDGETVRATARSYEINEMLGTKMRALMQREQGRDLFDLVHAWQLSEAGNTSYPVDWGQGDKRLRLVPGEGRNTSWPR